MIHVTTFRNGRNGYFWMFGTVTSVVWVRHSQFRRFDGFVTYSFDGRYVSELIRVTTFRNGYFWMFGTVKTVRRFHVIPLPLYFGFVTHSFDGSTVSSLTVSTAVALVN